MLRMSFLFAHNMCYHIELDNMQTVGRVRRRRPGRAPRGRAVGTDRHTTNRGTGIMSTTLHSGDAIATRVRATNQASGRAAATGGLASVARLNVGLAIIRAIVGVIFIAHGGQKLFVYGFAGIAEGFAGMGIPMAGIAGPAVSLIEFFGGIALLLGLFTPIAAGLLAMVMLGAIVMVHLPAGFFLPNGVEFPLALLAAAVGLIATGPGGYSLDAVRENRRSGS